MAQEKNLDEDIQFIAHYYRDDTLLPGSGWKQFISSHNLSHFRRNVAAAAACVVVLVASASIYFISTYHEVAPEEATTPVQSQTIHASEINQKIEFHDASLNEVVAEIERVYSVRVLNVPTEEIRITISYEGTASDVVETINELFDTNLQIKCNTDSSTEK